jgi:hypothetical protein
MPTIGDRFSISICGCKNTIPSNLPIGNPIVDAINTHPNKYWFSYDMIVGNESPKSAVL